jgi:hypothetical protein
MLQMRRRRLARSRPAVSVAATVIVAVALGLVAGGCGGGSAASGTDAASSPPQPSKTQYVARVNAICKERKAGLADRVSEFYEAHRSSDEPRLVLNHEVAFFVLLPTIQEEMAPMYYIPSPAEDEDRIDRMLSAERVVVEDLTVGKRLASIRAFKRRFIRVDRMLRAYGLYACQNGPRT